MVMRYFLIFYAGFTPHLLFGNVLIASSIDQFPSHTEISRFLAEKCKGIDNVVLTNLIELTPADAASWSRENT